MEKYTLDNPDHFETIRTFLDHAHQGPSSERIYSLDDLISFMGSRFIQIAQCSTKECDCYKKGTPFGAMVFDKTLEDCDEFCAATPQEAALKAVKAILDGY